MGRQESKHHWAKLSDEELRGANFALRLLHTSPRVTGSGLRLLKDLIEETYEELGSRMRSSKGGTPK